MNVEINQAGSSFSNLSIDTETLEKNAHAFPYSAYVRYLLLSNYKKNGHSDFEREAQKTVLYFNNAQWLQFQLSQLESSAHNGSGDSYSDTNHFAVLTEEQIESVNNAEEKTGIEKEIFLAGTKIQQDEMLPSLENIEEVNNENIFENVPREEEIFSAEILKPKAEATNAEEQASAIDANTIINAEENPVVYAGIIPVDTHSLNEEEAFQKADDANENRAFNEVETPLIETNEQVNNQQLEDKKEDEIIVNTELLIIPGAGTLESVATNEDVIAFEPLHTVDYFASQGIKITDEVFTNDKLGTQMKSFTEWLRSMKKLPNAKMPLQNSLAENIIQSAAETSNIDTEVLTEAMAEVLIKQDKREKAIEMYNKLSLINPAKSAYFAGKIESIKST